MSVSALNIAAIGLVQSERRATDIAERIVRGSLASAGFDADHTNGLPPQSPVSRAANLAQGAHLSSSDPLVVDIVALKTEQTTFQANAAAFKAFSETADELGRLLDEDS